MIQAQNVKLSKLVPNTGQIPDVPKNPRFIRDENYEKLKQSIIDDPEMLELREIIAYPHNGQLVVIGGNMRLRALRELDEHDETPVKVLPEDTPAKKLRAIAIKDNLPYGENDWDVMANEWDIEELKDWGLSPTNWNAPDKDDNEPEHSEGQGDTQNEDDDTNPERLVICPECNFEFNPDDARTE